MVKYYIVTWDLWAVKWRMVDIFPYHPGEDIASKFKVYLDHLPTDKVTLMSQYEIDDNKRVGLIVL